jgi:hypothetical protein
MRVTKTPTTVNEIRAMQILLFEMSHAHRAMISSFLKKHLSKPSKLL